MVQQITRSKTASLNGFGKQQMVKIGDLRIDTLYQRPLNQKRIESMAKDFDPELFGELLVSRRPNGDLYIVDGQHRNGTLHHLGWGGDQKVPAIVHEGLTLAQEAEIFHSFNAFRVKPSPIDLFHAAVASGDPMAMDIKKMINAIGMGVATGRDVPTSSGSPGKFINCVSKVQEVYRCVGRDAVKSILDVCVASWGLSHSSFMSVNFDGLGRFYAVHGSTISDAHLIKTLQKFGARDISSQGRTLKAATNSSQIGIAIAMIIESKYNQRAGQYKVADSTPARYAGAFSIKMREENRANMAEKAKTRLRDTHGHFLKAGA